jgi:hypothetical protein
MIGWMQRRTEYLNRVPAAGSEGGMGTTLVPQKDFSKALETVAALPPLSETMATIHYTPEELQRPRAACSLTVANMKSSLPAFYEQLLTEGRTKKGAEAVLAHALGPHDDTGKPGLVYVSPELTSDIKNCKYGLGWDMPYKNCHRGLSPFAVPHMSMRHQQERSAYQDPLLRASTTTLGDIKKARAAQALRPKIITGCYNCSKTASAS